MNRICLILILSPILIPLLFIFLFVYFLFGILFSPIWLFLFLLIVITSGYKWYKYVLSCTFCIVILFPIDKLQNKYVFLTAKVIPKQCHFQMNLVKRQKIFLQYGVISFLKNIKMTMMKFFVAIHY
ncbi:hypothetical protein C2G38_686685 [Gigaspora rosea]|uniref:Uncharacterized protein n=1 Tax=Gigaspora rosea TaxID=44941 RepID=A0A397U2B3_9GLOM|nr:hypothetical protein C2G38_686685 [Gigaspora rosea]